MEQELERAMAAGFTKYQQQDYAGVFAEWLPWAEKGDASAQYNIALLYAGDVLYER